MSNTTLFENQNYATLSASEHHDKYLNNDTALSCFFIQDKIIYKDVHGKYYYSAIIDETQMEFVYFDDLALVKELMPADEKLLALIKTLEDRNNIVQHFNLHLIEIHYDTAPKFILYSEDMQLFIALDLDSFNAVDETLSSQLHKLSLKPNTFADPISISLNAEGGVLVC